MNAKELKEQAAIAALPKCIEEAGKEMGFFHSEPSTEEEIAKRAAEMAVRMADELVKRLQEPVKNDTWTIFDAVNGDVLVADGQHPFIYNGHFDERSVGAHGGVDIAGNFKATISGARCWTIITKDIRLATEEECRYLHGKMKQAGYYWDGIDRELKKEEQSFSISKDMNKVTKDFFDTIDGMIKGKEAEK